MDTVKLILYCFAGVGFWTVSASIVLWFRDRSGNSGRDTHWTTNPRIRSLGERESRDKRINEIMDVCTALHGDTLRALAESERNDRELLEEYGAYGAMVMAMKPREDRRDEPNGL